MSTEMVRASGVEALPSSAAVAGWTPQQRALMVFAGIAKNIMSNGVETTIVPNPGVAEAFLLICKRTGLDPFAKQIYAMEVNGSLTIVTGVDGFRIVAQRSQGYEGQIGPQWWTGRMVDRPLIIDGRAVVTPEGKIVTERAEEWVSAWVPEAYGLEAGARPVAARVGVLRKGFREPLWQVVTWKEFGVEPRYAKDNWGVRPAHMLGIRAETHGLRRAFPNDLSGLYTPEDFDEQSGELNADIEREIKYIEGVQDLTELGRYYQELSAIGMSDKTRQAFMKRAGDLGAAPKDPTAPGDPVPPKDREGLTEEQWERTEADTAPTPTQEAPPQHRPARGQSTMRPEPASPRPTRDRPAEHEMTEEEWEAQEREAAERALGGED